MIQLEGTITISWQEVNKNSKKFDISIVMITRFLSLLGIHTFREVVHRHSIQLQSFLIGK